MHSDHDSSTSSWLIAAALIVILAVTALWPESTPPTPRGASDPATRVRPARPIEAVDRHLPFEELADRLDQSDEEPLPDDALATTEPAAGPRVTR